MTLVMKNILNINYVESFVLFTSETVDASALGRRVCERVEVSCSVRRPPVVCASFSICARVVKIAQSGRRCVRRVVQAPYSAATLSRKLHTRSQLCPILEYHLLLFTRLAQKMLLQDVPPDTHV